MNTGFRICLFPHFHHQKGGDSHVSFLPQGTCPTDRRLSMCPWRARSSPDALAFWDFSSVERRHLRQTWFLALLPSAGSNSCGCWAGVLLQSAHWACNFLTKNNIISCERVDCREALTCVCWCCLQEGKLQIPPVHHHILVSFLVARNSSQTTEEHKIP